MQDTETPQHEFASVTPLRLWVEVSVLDVPADRRKFVDNLAVAPATDNPTTEVFIFDVVGCVLDYGLNEIPSCTLSVALGRQVDTLKAATLHRFFDAFPNFIPVKVFLQAGVTWGHDFEEWPEEPQLIFDGYSASAAFRTTHDTVEFVLSLTHWLADLNFSSALSETVSPASPVNIAYASAMSSLTPTAQAHDTWWGATAAATGLVAVTGTDFWGYRLADNKVFGLKSVLSTICGTNHFNWLDLSQLGLCQQDSVQKHRTNAAALRALNRFEPFYTAGADSTGAAGTAARDYFYGVPLAMRKTVLSANASQRLGMDIGHGLIRDLIHNTMWDRLVAGYAPNYLFSLVPLVSRALVVPFTPGLRQTDKDGNFLGHRVIYAREYDHFETQNVIPRPIRGVGLLINRSLDPMGARAAGMANAPSIGTAGPLYDTCQDGIILFKRPPPWLADLVIWSNATSPTTTQNQINTNQQGNANTATLPAASQPQVQDFVLWTAFARTLYVQEVLRHRQGRVSGKLRFDICPGSSVAIEVPKDKFVQAEIDPDQTGELTLLHGTVLRVTTTINAEAQRASTAYHLCYLRTATEDTDDKTSVDGHPIWEKQWYGAPLLDPP